MNSAIEQRNGRTLVGTVISDKCDKTIVVRVETLVQHPLLKKYVRLQSLDIAFRKRLNFGRSKRRLWSAQCKSFMPMTECSGIAKCGLGKRFLLMS